MRKGILAFLVLAALACSGPSRSGDFLKPGGAAGYSVLLVDFDDLRADRVGAMGSKRGLTPNLDSLARSSFVFPNAVSQAPWTLPSTLSVMTSLYPHQHGVINKFSIFTESYKEIARLPRRFQTLAELFKKNGYATAAFTGDAGVGPEFGFARGFDVYYASVPFSGFPTTFPIALDWIKRHQGRKFFVFIHGYDVHGQYPPGDHSPTRKEFLKLRMDTIKKRSIRLSPQRARFWSAHYDRKVRRADERFGSFWKAYKALPCAKRTVTVILSDHGEAIDDHGQFDHGMSLYDELLRTLLVVDAPPAGGRKIESQVRLIDVMPTLVSWLGLRKSASVKRQMQGSSLLPLMRGESLPLEAYSETSFLLSAEKRSLRTPDGWKLIYDLETMTPELFNLSEDPGEKRNLATKRKDKVSELWKKLSSWIQSPAPETGQ